MNRNMLRGALAATTLLLLTACGGGDDADTATGQYDDLDSLYDAAVGADQTTIRIYGPAENTFAPVYEAFQEKYPEMKVETETLFGAQLRTRLDQESITGKSSGDLVHLEDAADLAAGGYLQSLEPFTATDVNDDAIGYDSQLVSPSYAVFGLAYNTDAVSEPPEDWGDLLVSKWKGRIGMGDATTVNGTTNGLTAAVESGVLDNDYLTKLAAQDPRPYGNNSELGTAVVTGQSDIGLIFPASYYNELKKQDAPIGFKFPLESGSYITPFPYGMLESSPSSLGTELLVNWTFTEEGQEAIVDSFAYGTVNGSPRPEGLPEFADIKTFTMDPKKSTKALEQWIPEFTKIFD